MELNELNSKLLRRLRTFAVGWLILWISLGSAYYIWFKTNGPTQFQGLWFVVVILFQPSVLLALIAIPEILVAAIVARIRIKESKRWRKNTSSISTQPSNQE